MLSIQQPAGFDADKSMTDAPGMMLSSLVYMCRMAVVNTEHTAGSRINAAAVRFSRTSHWLTILV